MKIFVTSDTHSGHKNIIRYCNRPFRTVEEMDYALEAIWNSLVSPKDIVFHLGDFALTSPNKCNHILNHLNGKKILIIGNHDKDSIQKLDSWKRVYKNCNFVYKGIRIYMRHEPWDEINQDYLYLHGHCHGTKGIWNKGQIDVGVDCWDFAPVELEEIIDFWRANQS